MPGKHVLVAAALLLAVSGTAWAGEGNGDPFPGPDAAVTTVIHSPHYSMGGSAPFNYYATGRTIHENRQASGGAGMSDQMEENGQVIRAGRPRQPAVASAPSPGNRG